MPKSVQRTTPQGKLPPVTNANRKLKPAAKKPAPKAAKKILPMKRKTAAKKK